MPEKLNVRIRPVAFEDARAIHEMRISPGVLETITSIPSERLCDVELYLRSLAVDDHVFMADVLHEGAWLPVGMASVNVQRKLRKRHTGVVGIFVHSDWQGRGIGKKLMEQLVDLADNWLMLLRLELIAFTENEHAIGLYRSFGFEVEGTLRAASLINGRYADDVIMGRIRP